MEMLISFYSETWHLPTVPKLLVTGIAVLDWPAKSPELNPTENLQESYSHQPARNVPLIVCQHNMSHLQKHKKLLSILDDNKLNACLKKINLSWLAYTFFFK